MVKSLLLFLLLNLSCVYAETYILEPQELIEEKPSHEENLSQKIQQLLGENAYARHVKFINIIFADTAEYITNERVDVAKVIATLKDNGLLDLFFKKPQELHLTFQSSGYPLFFVKIMSDTLQAMGYYRFITDKAKQDESGFFWTIRLTSEYAIDPVLLKKALQKRGCDIVDIDRITQTDWSYHIDIKKAYLMLEELRPYTERVLRKSLYEHWLNVKSTKSLVLWSLKGNNWYPYVSFYDKELHLLKVYKRDKRTKKITLELPEDTTYVKIADLYSLKNIKQGLRVQAKGTR
ncbi:hypothetical protein JHD50_13335 [Sulfurimonas sp. MAG313]|nr:hypothetical protein [Sulfurimonas sp. MAG313]MDF1882271.1 hypothetical protein [Sulfurimonas sp. MAG313]